MTTSSVAIAGSTGGRLKQWLWADVAGLPVAVWAYVACFVVAVFGLLWDGGWHASWGRDTFFIPPHNMLYAAVTFVLGLSTFIIVRDASDLADPALTRLGPFRAPLGVWTSFAGCMMLIGAAPFDEWWHRTFGRDDGTGLWSPPHFIGMVGGLLVCLGIIVTLRLREKPQMGGDGKPRRLGGLTANDAVTLLMFAYLTFIVGALSLNFYAIRHWYRYDAFYPILALMFGPTVLVLAQRLTGRAGAATVALTIPFALIGGMGLVLRAAHYPIVVSLPVMAFPSAILLDMFYARFGSGYRWLLVAGPLAALVFYPSEFGWAWLLNGRITWPLADALRALPLAMIAATLSVLLGAWIAGRFERLRRV
ncbi:MAG: hypothetical protein HY260_20150 [Chloroflexi bacterium]|nr:hypothetical protein [Chloroflexota bacterium]